MWGLVAGLAMIGGAALLEGATSRPVRRNTPRRAVRKPHVSYLVDQLASAYYQRAILRWGDRDTAPVDRDIVEARRRLREQGVTPIELRVLEAELRDETSRLEKMGLKKNGLSPARDLEQQLRDAFGDVFERLAIFEGGDRISVYMLKIRSSRRGQGIGRRVMETVAAYADATGKTITLTPEPMDGSTKTALRRFYKSLGFVDNKGRNKDFTLSEAMYRRPRAMQRNGLSIIEERSPLRYRHSAPVMRLSVVDPDASLLGREMYFAPDVKVGSFGSRKKTVIPGASPGVVAWLDYHLIQGYGPTGRGIYIDYMRTRSDQTQRGHMKRLLEALMAKYPGDDIDFGDIVSDHVEKVWRRLKDDASHGRRIYGKLR